MPRHASHCVTPVGEPPQLHSCRGLALGAGRSAAWRGRSAHSTPTHCASSADNIKSTFNARADPVLWVRAGLNRVVDGRHRPDPDLVPVMLPFAPHSFLAPGDTDCLKQGRPPCPVATVPFIVGYQPGCP